MAQGLHFGVKAGVLGNKANISGMRDQFKEESLTGFQVGPMLQYQTGFHGIALDFSLLYVERGIKLTNTSNRRSADIKTQSIDIPIELKWEKAISNNFELFLLLLQFSLLFLNCFCCVCVVFSDVDYYTNLQRVCLQVFSFFCSLKAA